MSIANFSLERVTYPLRVNWVISRGGSSEKNNFYIKEGDIIHSEFAPNIRFGDSDRLIEKQFESFIERYQREKACSWDARWRTHHQKNMSSIFLRIIPRVLRQLRRNLFTTENFQTLNLYFHK